MTTEADHYAWWRAAIKGTSGPISADNPQCGRYKMRRKNGQWIPVAIYINGGEIKAAAMKELVDPLTVWTYCAKNPIDEDSYRFAIMNGRFADEPEAPQQRNMPSDPFEALKVEIEDRAVQAAAWLAAHPEITTLQDCNLARNMQAQLISLGKRADSNRETEKRPHMEAANAVQAKYTPLLDAARTWAVNLRAAYEGFMKKEERRLKEEADAKYKADCAAAEAERRRIEAAQAKRMADDPIAALTEPPPELPEAPLAPQPVKVQAGGGVGRKAGLKSVYVGVIEDYAAALQHFAEHPDVRACVEKLVKAAVRVGKDTTKIPGVRVEEDRRAA